MRILKAAFAEFSGKGFAGARVDVIARRARANKRMIYHYFKDKDGLFCEVLRQKISERTQKVARAAVSHHFEVVPWFQQNCLDKDWIRLLAWESLQSDGGKIMGEVGRRRHIQESVKRIKQQQAEGRLLENIEPAMLQLAMAALTMFPVAMPQLTRLITGKSPQDAGFQRSYIRILETIAGRLRP